MQKKIILGTALWGWTVDKETCFKLLDLFYEHGGRLLDTAKNYPINGDPGSFLLAENLIAEWIDLYKVKDLELICKIGSVSNEMTSENDMSEAYINSEIFRLKETFGTNLNTIMIHWDDRSDQKKISDSISAIIGSGLNLGLSGIKNPEIYYNALKTSDYKETLVIEAKYNFLQRASIPHYSPILEFSPEIFAYGISVSGLKMDKYEYKSESYVKLVRPDSYHDNYMTPVISKILHNLLIKYPFASNIYDLAIIFSEASKVLSGYIVGANTPDRLQQIFTTRKNCKSTNISITDFTELRIE